MPSKRCMTRPEGMKRSLMTPSRVEVRADLGLHVVVPVSRVQAGERMAGDASVNSRQGADRAV